MSGVNRTIEPRRSAGQRAYEAELEAVPNYPDGTPRRGWHEIDDVARLSWEKNPTPRWIKQNSEPLP